MSGDSFAVGVCLGPTPGTCSRVCSGVLIAPNLVVSSRHCVDSAPDGRIDCAQATFGAARGQPADFWITTNSTVNQTATAWHRTKRIVRTPGQSLCGRDIALFILEDDISSKEAFPATPLLSSSEIVNGVLLTAIGFGGTSPDAGDVGARRIRSDIPVRCVPADESHPCERSDLSLGVKAEEFLSGEGVCFGDSGSGAFLQSELANGRAFAVGVLSRGLESGSLCANGIYTRTDEWAGLIQYAAHEANDGKYDPPAWFQASNGDAGLGGLGERCYESQGCTSAMCGSIDDVSFYCTQACDVGSNTCPTGFWCAATYANGLCLPDSARSPSAPNPGCNCVATPSRADHAWSAVLAFTVFKTFRRTLRYRRQRRLSPPRSSCREA